MQAHPFWIVVGLSEQDSEAETAVFNRVYIVCVCMTRERAIEVRDQLAAQREAFETEVRPIEADFAVLFRANNERFKTSLTPQMRQDLYTKASEIRDARARRITDLLGALGVVDRRIPWESYGEFDYPKYTVVESSDDPSGMLGAIDMNDYV